MDRAKVATECVRIERRGGSVRDYLAGLGCISPWGTWHRLQVEELGRKPHEITDGKANKRKRIGYDAELEEWTMGKTIITPEDRLEAVKIALEGGSPLTYLEGLGITKASAAWAHIKKRLKEDDPDMFAKLPKRLTSRGGVFGRKKPEIPESVPADVETPEEKIPFDPEIPEPVIDWVKEIPEKEDVQKPNVTMPLMYMGRTVTAVENEDFGEFHRSGDWIDWETKDGNVISFTIPEWKMLHHMMEDDFRILGVEL